MSYIFIILGLILFFWGIIKIFVYILSKIKATHRSLKKTQYPKSQKFSNQKNRYKKPSKKSLGETIVNEIKKERKELINKVNEQISVYKKMKDAYYEWYNSTITGLGTKTPVVLAEEKSILVKLMNKNLDRYEEIINKLQNCKTNSTNEIRDMITFSTDAIDIIEEDVQLMISQLSTLSTRWNLLSDEEKNNLGNLRKL